MFESPAESAIRFLIAKKNKFGFSVLKPCLTVRRLQHHSRDEEPDIVLHYLPGTNGGQATACDSQDPSSSVRTNEVANNKPPYLHAFHVLGIR